MHKYLSDSKYKTMKDSQKPVIYQLVNHHYLRTAYTIFLTQIFNSKLGTQ